MKDANLFRTQTKCLTLAEFSACMGVSLPTAWRWVKQGRVPFLKIGRTIRFDPKILATWVEQGCPSAISVAVQRVVDVMFDNELDNETENSTSRSKVGTTKERK